MSSSIQATGQGGGVFTFVAAKTDQGFILDQASREEEELKTPGVDGRRWRSKGLQHDEFKLTTVSVVSSFTDAVVLAKEHQALKGQNVYLTLDAAGTAVPFRNIHVKGVEPVPTRGEVTGAGVSGGVTAHVITVWTLVPTNFSDSDNVAT